MSREDRVSLAKGKKRKLKIEEEEHDDYLRTSGYHLWKGYFLLFERLKMKKKVMWESDANRSL